MYEAISALAGLQCPERKKLSWGINKIEAPIFAEISVWNGQVLSITLPRSFSYNEPMMRRYRL
jgi:hypothetical protein